jgi:hypothetical protein
MKHKIEEYREHTIYYDEEADKFVVELITDENWMERARKSLKECRKSVDENIRLNANFKPITCFYERYSDPELCKIVKVRSDGGVVIEQNGKRQSVISALENSFKKYSPDMIDWLEGKKKMYDRHKNECAEMHKKKPKLEPLDMTFIEDYKLRK